MAFKTVPFPTPLGPVKTTRLGFFGIVKDAGVPKKMILYSANECQFAKKSQVVWLCENHVPVTLFSVFYAAPWRSVYLAPNASSKFVENGRDCSPTKQL
jgi:hypothetical protein